MMATIDNIEGMLIWHPFIFVLTLICAISIV